MKQKLLITYATKYGATIKIAEKVRDELSHADLDVYLLPIADVADVTMYDAVVVGSAIYLGRWRKEAVDFLRAYADDLAARPVWLFASGQTGEGDAVALAGGEIFPEELRPLITYIHPHDVKLFRGKITLEKLSPAERQMIAQSGRPVGDFRDWDEMANWAAEIATQLHAVQLLAMGH